jgi:Na+-driven multidrug efflux pump
MTTLNIIQLICCLLAFGWFLWIVYRALSIHTGEPWWANLIAVISLIVVGFTVIYAFGYTTAWIVEAI